MGTKKWVMSMLLILSTITYSQPKDNHTSMITNPEHTVFLWDLHGVVFERYWNDWIDVFWRFDRKLELLKHLNSQMFKIVGNYFLHKIKLSDQELTSEEFMKVAREAGNDAFIDLTLRIGSAYHPIQGILDIIHQLKVQGFAQHVGSNIGVTLFDRFTRVYPEIFSEFSAHQVVHVKPGQKVIKKPNPEYFHIYLATHNLKPEQIIFIDDKKANVDAALAVGMHAIQFKNPQQIKNELEALGFNFDETTAGSIIRPS